MMNKAKFVIVEETDTYMLIRDIGPWDVHPSITNSAKDVVAQLQPRLNGRRLFYYDSLGDRDELVIRDDRFVGFAPARQAPDDPIYIQDCRVADFIRILSQMNPTWRIRVPIYPPGDDSTHHVCIEILKDEVDISGFDPGDHD